jgi:hypothetical protein
VLGAISEQPRTLAFVRSKRGPTGWWSTCARPVSTTAIHGDLPRLRERALQTLPTATSPCWWPLMYARGLDIEDIGIVALRPAARPKDTCTGRAAPPAPVRPASL